MITEPEMPGATDEREETTDGDRAGTDGPVDLLSDADRPVFPFGRLRRRPWVWAVGGALASSAVWAATVVPGTADGAGGPDLHGYHLRGNPCSGDNLKALTDAVGARSSTLSPALLSKGPALDRASCVVTVEAPTGDGWVTTYSIDLDVALHKQTDPRAEFDNADHAEVSHLPGGSAPVRGGDGSSLVVIGTSVAQEGYDPADEIAPVPGLGDSAYLISSSRTFQSLKVLHGGAVLTLDVSAFANWNGPGVPPGEAASESRQPDLGRLHLPLPAVMRHLMSALSS